MITEGDDLVCDCGWANNKRVIYVQDKGVDENHSLYAVNLDGTQNKHLTPFDAVQVSLDDALKASLQQQNNIEYILHYRTAEDQEFKPVVETSWQDNFYIIDFNYQTENPHDAYVVSNLENDTDEILC